jgi:lycopene beta-cyclase
MPFSATRIFLEETSLVARPAVPFAELKRRMDARLAHLGIRITGFLLWLRLIAGAASAST